MLDGSFIAQPFYHSITTAQLMEEVRSIALPSWAAGHKLADWCVGNKQVVHPGVFAVLKGLDGLVINIGYSKLIIGNGRFSGNSLGNLLGDKLHGIPVDYSEDEWSGSSDGVSCIATIHLDNDVSIARRHAVLEFDDEMCRYSLRAISPAGVYIDGDLRLPGDGCTTLINQTVVQIGKQIFYFMLPSENNTTSSLVSPIDHSINVCTALMKSIQYRQFLACLAEGEIAISKEVERQHDELVAAVNESEVATLPLLSMQVKEGDEEGQQANNAEDDIEEEVEVEEDEIEVEVEEENEVEVVPDSKGRGDMGQVDEEGVEEMEEEEEEEGDSDQSIMSIS